MVPSSTVQNATTVNHPSKNREGPRTNPTTVNPPLPQPSTTQRGCCQGDRALNQSFVNEKLHKAFGANLSYSETEVMNDDWGIRWTKIVGLKSQLYDLCGRALGHEFVSLLTGEVTLLSRDEAKSEHLIVCMNLMLQRDVMIHRAADIRRPLK